VDLITFVHRQLAVVNSHAYPKQIGVLHFSLERAMRKKSSRSPRAVAKLLSPVQQCHFVIGPRIHLELLLAGKFDLTYVGSVGGFLNIAGSAAHIKGCTDVLAEIHRGQNVVQKLFERGSGPDEDEACVLRGAMNIADHWLVGLDTAILSKAIGSCERETVFIRKMLYR
jgi:hypothetical protein